MTRNRMIGISLAGLGCMLMAGCPSVVDPVEPVTSTRQTGTTMTGYQTVTGIGTTMTDPPTSGRPTTGQSANADSDGDGFTDQDEAYYGTDPYDNADPLGNMDTDGDGWSDWDEFMSGMDPYTPNYSTGNTSSTSGAAFDSDGDGFTDEEEYYYGTDPNDVSDPLAYMDSDGDGWSDWDEYMSGMDPFTPDYSTTGGSGTGGGSYDSDGDGFSDEEEYYYGTDPYDVSDPLAYMDSDGDGWSDWDEYMYGSDPYDWSNTP